MTKITEALSRMRELVLSWNLNEAVEFAKTEEGLKALSAILVDRNPKVRLRALSVLSRIVDETKSGKTQLLDFFFEPLVHLTISKDEKTRIRALPVLRRLLKGTHLQLREFEMLVSAMFSLADECDGIVWNEVMELFRITPVAVMPSGIASVVKTHLKSKNLRTATLAAYLLVRDGEPLEGMGEEFLNAMRRAFKYGDSTTVELALMVIEELLRVPPTYPAGTVLLGLVPYLKRFSDDGDVNLRKYAKGIMDTLLPTLRIYYRNNPWELKKAIRHLIRENRREDVILIASLMGDPSILLAGEGESNFAEGTGGEFGMMDEREI